jgi:c-di-GMP-binding flagellar brake protein YcgR
LRGFRNGWYDAVCSVFVTFQQKLVKSVGREKRWTSTSMNCPADTKGAIDGRRFPRYEIDTEVDVATVGAGDQRVMRGRSLNISNAGMAGLFVTGWPAGTAVTLKFPVPVVSSPLSVNAIVRSRSDYRYGFEFVELNPVQREIISKTCRTLALVQ